MSNCSKGIKCNLALSGVTTILPIIERLDSIILHLLLIWSMSILSIVEHLHRVHFERDFLWHLPIPAIIVSLNRMEVHCIRPRSMSIITILAILDNVEIWCLIDGLSIRKVDFLDLVPRLSINTINALEPVHLILGLVFSAIDGVLERRI
jgi:hypothetical protein